MELFSCKSGENENFHLRTNRGLTNLSYSSPKDIANLKNEIEKRQKEGSPENGEEIKEGASELPKDEAIAKAPAAVQS
jgi:hypothetical protein